MAGLKYMLPFKNAFFKMVLTQRNIFKFNSMLSNYVLIFTFDLFDS